MGNKPLVSIIIPSYNEKEDIRLSLNAAIGFKYQNKEIIVVDDSTDNTPEIIKEYEKYGVRLIHRGNRSNGCCGARNLGILEAKGVIVVLLNADVFPKKDFVDKILSHYENGADYVLVESKVANDKYLFPRFIEALHHYSYDGKDWIEWTEGFSCRRQAAIDVGLIPGDFPLNFCRDWLLGKKLGENRYNKVIDRSVVVPHIAPRTFKDYWRVRKTRGRFSAMFKYFIEKVSLKKLTIRIFLKSMFTFSEIILVFPLLFKCIKIASFSPRKIRDVIPFVYAYVLERIAFTVGEWEGCIELFKNSLL